MNTISAREAQGIAALIGELNRNLAVALEWAGAGYRVFPCGQDKRPLVKGWQAKATTDKATIRRWWKRHADAMPGLPTGPENDLAVLDVDRKNGKDGFAALRNLGHDPADLSPAKVTTPSGGQHSLFRWREGMGNSADGLPAGVDVRGEGGFIIAPGAVSPKGAYTPIGDGIAALWLVGPEMLPEWPEALRRTARKADNAPPAEPGQIGMDRLRAALLAIPNDGSNPELDSRDGWLRIGMSLHFETGGSADGLDLWQEWSAQWPGYDADAAEDAWQSFRRRDGALITGATILAEAAKHGWRDHDRIGALFDEAMQDAPPVEPAAGGLTFLSPADCTTATARRYVVKGLVAAGDVGAIVGAPGVGKSLFAPRLAYAVAQGRRAFGLKVRQGGVLYVAAEDETGMRARISALREEHGDAPDFALVGGVTSLFADGDHKALRDAVKARKPALIVIDTLAMAFPGLKENEAESMGLVVAAARALTKWDAAVLLVHHDTKDGTQGLPRGHSILNGALDMSLHLTKDGNVVRCRPTKNRNGSADIDLAFTIATRVLGKDEDDDDIRAAFARDLEPGDVAARPDRLSPSAKAALDLWTDLAGQDGAVEESIWRQTCVDSPTVSAAEDPASRRRAFKRAAEELTRKYRLVFQGGKYLGAKPSRSDASERFADGDC